MANDPENYLPHRKPFLFVDEFVATQDGRSILGSRTFREDDVFFAGHFPGNPVVPGVILVEAMAQCGGAGLAKAGLAPPDSIYVLGAVAKAKFHRLVRPGERLDIEVKTLRIRRGYITQRGKGYVDGVLAVEARWLSATLPTDGAAKG